MFKSFATFLLTRQANRWQQMTLRGKEKLKRACSCSERGRPFLNTKDSERRSVFQSRSQSFVNCLIVGLIMLPILAIAGPISLEEARKAVVFIAIESNPFELSYGPNPGYYYGYLRPVYDYFWPSSLALGSGFIISQDGYVITNSHVVKNATKVLVIMRMPDVKLCKATVLGKDPRCDIAILKLEVEDAKPLPYLTLGDSDKVEIGDRAILIGNPKGLEFSVTAGVISEKNRNYGRDDIEGYFQTDITANQGSSGSPLLNSEFEVIGILFGGYEGFSFDIQSNIAREIARQVIENGKITQGFLGVKLGENTIAAFDYFYFDRNEGAKIESLIEDSPAQRAGLKAGDVIFELNGRSILSSADLKNKVAVLAEDTAISLKVYRDREIFEFDLILGKDELSKQHSDLRELSL
jgi:S1-C subfamily serine protease